MAALVVKSFAFSSTVVILQPRAAVHLQTQIQSRCRSTTTDAPQQFHSRTSAAQCNLIRESDPIRYRQNAQIDTIIIKKYFSCIKMVLAKPWTKPGVNKPKHPYLKTTDRTRTVPAPHVEKHRPLVLIRLCSEACCGLFAEAPFVKASHSCMNLLSQSPLSNESPRAERSSLTRCHEALCSV